MNHHAWKPLKPGSTIILDIDECKLHAYSEPKDANIIAKIKEGVASNPLLRRQCFRINLADGECFVVKRPYLDEFINFIFRYFEHVIVWSAGRYDYVHKICEVLFNYRHRKPDAILTGDDIEVRSPAPGDYHKPLSTVIAKYPHLCRLESTLFLDNVADNFLANPDNGMTIPDFYPTTDPFAQDDHLLRVMEWLMLPEVLNAKDVRQCDKWNIFRHPPKNVHTDLMMPIQRYLSTPPTM